MVGSRIALVTCETICGIYCIHLIHITISRRLRQNRGGADGGLGHIAVDDGTRRQHLTQSVQIGKPVAIHQHVIRRQRHGQQRAAHGQKCRLQNIQRVDFGLVRPADTEAQRFAPDLDAEPRALLGAQGFRIGDAFDGSARPQNDGRRHHRSRERSAARLIDAGNAPHGGDATAGWRVLQKFENGLRRAGARATAQIAMNTRELVFQGAAPFGIVKPHQELRSDRLWDYLVLKIFADDAPIRK